MGDDLIVKPFFGEFGWQLMRWQGIARARSRGHRRTRVFCQQGYEYLYEDFAHSITSISMPDGIERDMYRGMLFGVEWEPPIENMNGFDVLAPGKWVAHQEHEQEFIKYGEPQHDGIRVLLHARATQYEYRNWPMQRWTKLVERLGLFANIKLASIGSKGAASCIPNTEDCRGIPLKELANLMRASRVVVSPSSGPAHFASLCGTPHIVWSDGKKWAMGLTNKARYKTEWNPFGTECTFIEHETWQPDVQEVLEAVCRYL